ncbi:MAG: hypothetical protein AAF502_09870 [Bacteroidota bacterium]
MDDLFQLIQSLSKTEKRYFKVNYAKSSASGSNYLRLFDAINQMATYDENILKKKFKGEKLLNNLQKEKAYLYRNILTSMRAYRKDKSSGVRIRELLADAAFLKERSLYDQCAQSLKKAKKLGYEYENYTALLEVLFVERELLKNLKPRKGESQMNTLILETSNILEALNVQCNYLDLYDNLFFQTLRSNHLRNDESIERLQEIMDHPLIIDEDKAKTFRDQHRLWSIKAMNALLNASPHEAYQYNQKILNLWQGNKKIRLENIYIYRNMLSNFLSSCLTTRQLDMVPSTLEELKQIPPKNHHDEGTAFKHIYQAQLSYHTAKGEFEKGKALVPQIEAGMEKHHDSIGTSSLLTIHGNITILFFLMEDFDSALTWGNKIIQFPKSNTRMDIQRFSRLINLLLHFELGHTELLENLIRSTARYIKGLPTQHEIETSALRFFRKLINTAHSDLAQLFLEFQEDITRMKMSGKQQNVFTFSVFDLWVAAKASKRSVTAVYRKRFSAEVETEV